MEKIKWTLLLLSGVFTIAIMSCKEDYVGQPPHDTIPPGVISNPVVTNIAGGALITYTLPDDNDLLYVKAVYTINGVEKTTSASMYNSSVEIKGFGSTDEQTIALYCVDRSQNESEPVLVKINPETPPVELIYQSLEMEANFGGIRIKWKNEHQADVALYILAEDSDGELNIVETVYTSASEGTYSLRGFENTEKLFGIYIRDRWDNFSETYTDKFTPLYEIELDKSKFKRETLQGDNTTEYDASRSFMTMFDGMVNDYGWHTKTVVAGPKLFTVDLGAKVKLSRFTLWHRIGSSAYQYRHHNPKNWTIYGTEEPRRDIYDDEYWIQGGFIPDWPLQKYCEVIKPSGLPVGQLTEEDTALATAGFEFEFEDTPTVRYVRFWIHETYSGGLEFHISELSFFGEYVED